MEGLDWAGPLAGFAPEHRAEGRVRAQEGEESGRPWRGGRATQSFSCRDVGNSCGQVVLRQRPQRVGRERSIGSRKRPRGWRNGALAGEGVRAGSAVHEAQLEQAAV